MIGTRLQYWVQTIMTMKNTTELAMLLVVLASGCRHDGKVHVSGSVTLDGQSVNNGSISFEAADGGPGVYSGGIHEGSYELRSTPGSKKVRITAYRSRRGQSEPTSRGLSEHTSSFENYIPARYNDKTSLVREVAPDENQIGFSLASK